MCIPLAAVASEGGGFNPLDFSQLGILIWTVVIFLAAIFPIWKVVMGPVAKGMAERDRRAETAIAAAEEARRETEKVRAEVEARLEEARAEAAKTVAAARARAEAREREMTAEATKNADRLLERARAEIRSEQDKAIALIR